MRSLFGMSDWELDRDYERYVDRLLDEQDRESQCCGNCYYYDPDRQCCTVHEEDDEEIKKVNDYDDPCYDWEWYDENSKNPFTD